MASQKQIENARKALSQLLELRADETLLIITDEKTKEVASAFKEAGEGLGAQVRVFAIEEGQRPLKSVPEDLKALIQNADVAVTCFRGVPEETPFRIELIHALTKVVRRLGHAPGITPKMLEEGPLACDYEAMTKLALELMERFSHVKRVRITSPAGTDLAFSIDGREFKTDTVISDGEWGNLPSGEIFCAPVEDSAEGVLVCDGSIGDIGTVTKPMKLVVQGGAVVRVECEDALLQKRVEELLSADKEAKVIGEFGIGVNPSARITGNLLEDEKALGTIHVAFGNNLDMPGGRNASRTHRDFMVLRPTVLGFDADGKEIAIMKDGEFVSQEKKAGHGTPRLYKNILAAVDFSDKTKSVLDLATSLANISPSGKLTICYVIPEQVAVSPLFPHYVATPNPDSIKREQEMALAKISEVIASFGVEKPDYELVVRSGKPASEIVRLAEEIGADLVIVASTGASRIARMLLGSVAESVVRHAHCDVLVVR
jgi:leucyl aminopeptidase (aminopeptidase T)/nucleotide-binding universal stress UspA family protein